MTESVRIVAGADTHADTIHLAAVTITGALVGDREFPTTRAGYAAAIRFLRSLGRIERIGVEGTASYGAGFTRAATAAGMDVVEVTRAVKSTRRLKGKSDPLDAYSAARTALAGDGLATPKGDATAGLRALHIARRSAVKHRTAVINQIKAMLITAPDAVREKYCGLTTSKLVEAIARCRPDALTEPWAQSVLTAAKILAQRVQFARQAKNITVTAAANYFGVWPTVISRIERGLQRTTPSPRPTETGYKPLDTNRSIISGVLIMAELDLAKLRAAAAEFGYRPAATDDEHLAKLRADNGRFDCMHPYRRIGR